MQTRAAVVEAPGEQFAIVDLEVDDPRDDEVLVRIVASGLCHTDLTLSGMLPAEMFPFVFGHEGAGVVEAVGADVTGVRRRGPRRARASVPAAPAPGARADAWATARTT